MVVGTLGRRAALAAGLVAGLMAGVPASALAQDQGAAVAIPAPVIAVVDVDKILQESTSAKAVRAQAEKYEQTFQQEIAKEESGLRTRQEEIDQQRKSLTPEAFAERARAFDGSVADFQRRGLARKRAFDRSYSAAMGQVQKAMLEATQEVAVTRGATVVLPRAQVMLFDDKMNITKDIIAVMDKKLPHVDFPAPKVDAEITPQTPSAPQTKK